MNQDERIKELERELQAKQYIINCLGNEFVDLKEEAAEADADLNIALAEVKMYKERTEAHKERISQLEAEIDSLKTQLSHKPLNP